MMRCNCLHSCLQMAREATSFIYSLLPSSEKVVMDENAKRLNLLWFTPITHFFYETSGRREEHVNQATENSVNKVSSQSRRKLERNDNRALADGLSTTASCADPTPPPPPSPVLSQVMDYSDGMASPTSPLSALHYLENNRKENEQDQKNELRPDRTRSPLVKLDECQNIGQGCEMQPSEVTHSLNSININSFSSAPRAIGSMENGQGQESAAMHTDVQLSSMNSNLNANCSDMDEFVLPPSEYSIALNLENILQSSLANDLSMIPTADNYESTSIILAIERPSSESIAGRPGYKLDQDNDECSGGFSV